MIFKPASQTCRHYTKLPNDLLRDKALPPEAIGLLCYLLSHVDNWRVTQSQLSKHFACTPARIRNIADCLEQNGYIRRVQSSKMARPCSTGRYTTNGNHQYAKKQMSKIDKWIFHMWKTKNKE